MNTSTTNIATPQAALFSSIEKENSIIITDENIFKLHTQKFKNYQVIIIKAGEKHKNQTTINSIVKQLLKLGANRTTTLIGVGGGVVTDITGYVASIFMRGIRFGFVPTTILALVDASIGGKNGIDFGIYKNIIGTINQPNFIVYDANFLATLPQAEWQNGFAEIIKHSCIKDAGMFSDLQNNSLEYYQANKQALNDLLLANANIKSSIVEKDVFEKGERKTLNFGHTLGHSIENLYKLPHGQAVAIGIAFACTLSTELLGFVHTKDVLQLLKKYQLPTTIEFNPKKVFNVLKMDKKREREFINYILLSTIGKAEIKEINLSYIKTKLETY